MSRLLPGNVEQRRCFILLPLLVLLLCAAPRPGYAAGDEQPDSGHVKPVVTKLTPSSFDILPKVDEYTLPTKYSAPYGLAIDSTDRLWVTLNAANAIGVLDPSTGEYKEYKIPSAKDLPTVDWKYDSTNRSTPEKTVTNYSVGNPGAIIVGKDRLIWFVNVLGNSVVRFDPEKEIFTEFIVPTKNAQPYDLADDGKGRIWFVEKNGGAFGYVNTKKKSIVEISLHAAVNLTGIAIDKDGQVWVSDANNNYLGRYNPEKKSFAKFPILTEHSQPGMMRFTDKGVLWFCQLRTRQLGVYMPDPGIFSVVDISGYNTAPQSLAIDKKSRVWFVDSMMNRIGFFNSESLQTRLFEITGSNSQPMDVEIDSKGDVWFTQSDRSANKIARLRVATIPPEEGALAQAANNTMQGQKKESPPVLFILALLAVVGLIYVFFFRKRS